MADTIVRLDTMIRLESDTEKKTCFKCISIRHIQCKCIFEWKNNLKGITKSRGTNHTSTEWLFCVSAVNFICDHPEIKAISFVGSDQAVSIVY